jgi:predicted transcriptional regulator
MPLIMIESEHILISLGSRHAQGIFAGAKKVELRRRIMRVKPGTNVWVYVKLPVACIIGRVTIMSVHASSPRDLWKRFGSVSGLSRDEFFLYFSGSTQGTALELDDAQLLPHALPLGTIRELAHGFHPPQFFSRLDAEHPVLLAVTLASEQNDYPEPASLRKIDA